MSREVFSTCNPLAIDCVLYQEEARTTLWGAGIYYDGVTCWDVNSSGVITGTTSCTTTSTTTTTTTSAPVEYQIDNASTGDSASACSGATTTSIVYAQPGYTTPIVGMILYTTQSPLSNPFVGSSGWRKLTGPLGTTYAVEIDTNGEITNYVTC